VADHYDVISNPMDLRTVRSCLESGQYAGAADWLRDVELIWSNAEDFNGPDSVVAVFAHTKRAEFEDLCLMVAGDCASWLWKVDMLFARPGKVRPFRDGVMDAERRHLRAAAGAVRATLAIVQTLTALGVVPASDGATASVEMTRLALFAVHLLAALMREQCEAARREYAK